MLLELSPWPQEVLLQHLSILLHHRRKLKLVCKFWGSLERSGIRGRKGRGGNSSNKNVSFANIKSVLEWEVQTRNHSCAMISAMIIVLLTSFVHCEQHPVPPSSLPWYPRKNLFEKNDVLRFFFFSCCFQDLSSTEDIRLADGLSYKEVIIFGLKFPPLLIMALKTSCHNSKISQPLDIRMLILRPLCSCPCMRPTDGIVFKRKKKAALLRFKFSNPLTEALKADCLKRKLAAPSSEEPWSSDVLLVSAQRHMSSGRVKDVQKAYHLS